MQLRGGMRRNYDYYDDDLLMGPGYGQDYGYQQQQPRGWGQGRNINVNVNRAPQQPMPSNYAAPQPQN